MLAGRIWECRLIGHQVQFPQYSNSKIRCPQFVYVITWLRRKRKCKWTYRLIACYNSNVECRIAKAISTKYFTLYGRNEIRNPMIKIWVWCSFPVRTSCDVKLTQARHSIQSRLIVQSEVANSSSFTVVSHFLPLDRKKCMGFEFIYSDS